ncbi:hypothetical protein LXL04_036845 [Taraxacum kok-saghyz]
MGYCYYEILHPPFQDPDEDDDAGEDEEDAHEEEDEDEEDVDACDDAGGAIKGPFKNMRHNYMNENSEDIDLEKIRRKEEHKPKRKETRAKRREEGLALQDNNTIMVVPKNPHLKLVLLLLLQFVSLDFSFFLLFVDWNGLRSAKYGMDAVESRIKACDLAKEALHEHPF